MVSFIQRVLQYRFHCSSGLHCSGNKVLGNALPTNLDNFCDLND